MSKQKTIFVTGGAGFVGSHLVDALIESGERVVVIDKMEVKESNKNARAEYVRLNIQDGGLEDVFAKYKPKTVFHLAAHLHDRESVEKPRENAMDNIIGLINVCEANRKAGQGKMIFTSSCAVYGAHSELPISEDVLAYPFTPYGITKLTGEQYLRFYEKIRGIPYIAFRPGNIYGPRQDSSAESGVIGIFSSRLAGNKVVTINNDGLTTRDYIYVADIVDALVKAIDSDFIGLLNLGTGIETSTNRIFEMVKGVFDKEVKFERNEDQQDAIKHIALDASKAREVLGWIPSVSLEEGIRKTVDWYRNNN